MSDVFNQKSRLSSSKAHNIRARDAVFLAILVYGRDGISGKGLEQKSGFSRQTINQERSILKKDGLIDYKTNGKRTTYFPSKEALNNRYFSSWVYGKELFNKLEGHSIFLDSPFFDSHFSLKNRTEQLFFEFSLRLGSILTYMFMQAMNPEFIKDLTFNKKISSREIKKYFISEWLKNAINPMQALMILRQSVYLLGCDFKVDSCKKPENYSFYELESKSFRELSEAFGRLYPYVYKELQGISNKLLEHVKNWKESIEQAKCNHEYKLKFKNEDKHFECSKCKAEVTIRPDEMVKNRKILDRLNNLKPPKDNCIKFGHHWQDRTGYEVNCFHYFCAICNEIVTFTTESEEKMEIIDEKISVNLGIEKLGLGKDIQYFFHRNNNKELAINDLLQLFKKYKRSMHVFENASSTDDIIAILDILVEHGYIEPKTPHHDDPSKRVYIRNKFIE
jgi:hypothetical protein